MLVDQQEFQGSVEVCVNKLLVKRKQALIDKADDDSHELIFLLRT